MTPAVETLRLSPNIVDVLLRSIRSANGREVCGYLLKDSYGEQQFFRLTNISRENYRFSLADYEMRRLEQYAQTRGFRCLALIHSHPDDPTASVDDKQFLQAMDIPWIIVAEKEGNLLYTIFGPIQLPGFVSSIA
jgi:proteasome lid subunit RPN8/RPN11